MNHLFSLPLLLLCSLGCFEAQLQVANSEPVKYYCSPCGCANDGKLFDSSGKCSACKMKLLPVGRINYTTPSLGPNNLLVFASDGRSPNKGIFIQQLATRSAPKYIGEGSMPEISADGRRILFHRENEGILIHDILTEKTTMVLANTRLHGLQSPAWNTAANGFYFSAGTFPNIGIYSMNLEDSTLKPIMTDPGMRYGCAPSPDGKKLAYRCVKGNDSNLQRGIAVLNLETNEEKYITTIGEYCKWSPDGKNLSFHWPNSGDFSIYTVHADGSALKKIAGMQKADYELPCWSPVDKKIYYQTNYRAGNWEIWRMNINGSGQEPVVW